ncbi:putative ribosomal protein L11/L12 [Helianthus debilis subsp. tardiflorus]
MIDAEGVVGGGGGVMEILGTCVSVGCTVDGKDLKDLQQKIADGYVETPV